MQPEESLGVREAARSVMERARDVRIDDEAVTAFAAAWDPQQVPVPEWDRKRHWYDGTARTANYVLVLDALNFCFWADPGQPRWTVPYRGQEYQGYWALTAALARAIEEGVPVLDARFLAEISLADTRRVLAGSVEIPLLEARQRHLQEVGRGLLRDFDGQFVHLVESCGRDAVTLAASAAALFPSFEDVATYDGLRVPLYKRAQILAVDLYGTFGGVSFGALSRLDELTAFADYKVPQVMRAHGLLHYSTSLAETIEALEEIPPGDPREVEIRAATVEGVERLRAALAARGHALRAFEVDWILWGMGQGIQAAPYHRTRTVFY